MLSQKQINQIKLDENKSSLQKRFQRYHYYGLLEEYQLHPTSIINTFTYTSLNSYQHFLFKRVLHGLNVYDKAEVENLHWDKKRRISKVWKRGQREINAWKQMICNKRVNAYFEKTFRGPSMKAIISVSVNDYLEDYNNTLSFKELGVNYEDVILLFMSKGLLPKNFLTLRPNNNQKHLKA